MRAVELKNNLAVVDINRCIGCGLCVSACPAKAMNLVRRSEQPDIPATSQEMGLKVLKEKGKLKRFSEIMKK
jgi:Fe-S-cluster-containing hydrogenase component 2